jgi:hypothetical protein
MNRSKIIRTNNWLAERMYDLWDDHFADVPRKNLVIITFGRASSRQLGSIKWARKNTRIKSLLKSKAIQDAHAVQDDRRITVITITRNFQDPDIPEYVVKATIAHEIVHYVHGFSSPLKQTYRYPHQGGIVRKELESRGLGELHTKARRWLRENWSDYS